MGQTTETIMGRGKKKKTLCHGYQSCCVVWAEDKWKSPVFGVLLLSKHMASGTPSVLREAVDYAGFLS